MSLIPFVLLLGTAPHGHSEAAADAPVREFLAGLVQRPPQDVSRHNAPGASAWYVSVFADERDDALAVASEATTQRFVLFDGWIENRDELIAALAVPGVTDAVTDSALVLAGYAQWGTAVAERLYGEYSFVVLEAGNASTAVRASAVRDKMGVRPLFFSQWHGGIGLANFPAALAALPWLGDTVNEGYVAEFLCGEVNSIEQTFLRDVARLRGGHRIEWASGAPALTRRYWLPPCRVDPMTATVAAQRLRALLEVTVAAAMRGARKVGIKQSGGVDSSAIAMVLADLVERGLRPAESVAALSMVFPGLACDESAYLDDIARVVPFAIERAPARYASADQLLEWTRRSRYPVYPFVSTGLSAHFAAFRSRGGRVVLDGEGGDELLRPSPLALLRALVDGRQSAAVAAFFRQRWRGRRRDLNRRGTVRFWLDPAIPEPLNNAWRRHVERSRHGWRSPLDEAWTARVALRDRLDRHSAHHRAARTVGAALALSGEWGVAYESIYAQAVLQQVELRHPLLSARLVEFCNCLPLALLDGQEARTRVLLRASVADRLPPSVAARRDKAEFTASVLPALHEACSAWLDVGQGSAALTGLGEVSLRGRQAQGVWGLDALRAVITWWGVRGGSRDHGEQTDAQRLRRPITFNEGRA
ncbi:MAG: hypothetical protein LC098_07955 [Burkholderiales bacterium]|nr:hypothetical protein [Burkholderiales bacterium]